jgi:hypothetical protein
MARYSTTVDSTLSREDAFAYMADFENVARWDPGVTEARSTDDGELAVGSAFTVVTTFMGLKTPLVYRVVELDAGSRIRLVAETSRLRSDDEIIVSAAGSGSSVTYNADLSLIGPLRLADPLLGLAFRVIGDRARDGLRRALNP